MRSIHHRLQPLIYAITLLIVMAGLMWFTIETNLQMRADFTRQIFSVQTTLSAQIKQLSDESADKLSILTGQLTTISQSQEENKRQALEQMSELSSTIETTKKENLDALTMLQSDLNREMDSLSLEAGDFSGVIESSLPAVVSIQTDKGVGSGSFVRKDGLVLTNQHVIADSNQIWVQTHEGTVFQAQLVAQDTTYDLALLRVSGSFSVLPFGSSNDLKVGERVIALGSPAGLGFTATQGILSAKNRVGPNNKAVYLQVDVPINPGNSGGPMLNSRGEIVGITNFKLKNFESLGFAIQSEVAKAFVDQVTAQLH